MRFVFIQKHTRIWRITTMCRVLEVSRAGYYAWRARPLCERVKTDRVLTAKIREIHDQVKHRFGSPRVRMELQALGFCAGKHRVARLMREAGVRATPRRRFRVTTDSTHQYPVVPNLVQRQFAVAHYAVNQTWVADITLSRRGKAGSISQCSWTSPCAASWGGRCGPASRRSSP
ncbi:MAG: IS3 family transposase [Gemmatimonadaceae bacterium]